jgi:hypothetical protein
MEIVAGMTTWFCAAARHGSLPEVKYETGRRLLARASSHVAGRIPDEWRDSNGSLTLVGVGLVLQMGHPAYMDRCAVSYY